MAELGGKRNRFLMKNPENGDLNQYWYSKATIDAIAAEVEEFGSGGTAFLSTPSIYFSLDRDLRAKCKVFDLDTKWAKDPGFVLYDYTKPQDIPETLRGTFDMVVVDPPFVTRQVWESYTAATKLLLRPGGAGLVLCSTILENAPFMEELLGASPCEFKPSIPNLVYQYSLYVNYDSKRLASCNPEIPSEA
ncbi:unnamed protein product [Ectocarpus sp. 6 AP-2014]